jgi:intracellular sulfur oxidation DsrE/DsrF family protein
MRYIIFNILLIILLIVILFNPCLINEHYVEINSTNAGYFIGIGPPTKIKYFKKEEQTQSIEANEEIVNPIEYSEIIITKPIIKKQPEPVKEKQPEPEIKVLTISCLQKLENRKDQIVNNKNDFIREAKDRYSKNQTDDQRTTLAVSQYLEPIKNKLTEEQNINKDENIKLNNIKVQVTACKNIISSFNIEREQVRNCCSTERKQVIETTKKIDQECKIAQNRTLTNELINIQNTISDDEKNITVLKDEIEDVTAKINNCNKETKNIQDQIDYCKKYQ